MAYLRLTLFDFYKELITYVQISNLRKYNRRDINLSSSEIRMLVGLPTTILLSLLCSLFTCFFCPVLQARNPYQTLRPSYL
jgi:hypothetical protein